MGASQSKRVAEFLAAKNNRELVRLFVIGQCLVLKHEMFAALTRLVAKTKQKGKLAAAAPAVAAAAAVSSTPRILQLLNAITSSTLVRHSALLAGSAVCQRALGARASLYAVPALVFCAQHFYRTVPYPVLAFYETNEVWVRNLSDRMRNEYEGVWVVAALLIVALTIFHPYTTLLNPAYKNFCNGLVGVPYPDQLKSELLDLSSPVDQQRIRNMWTIIPRLLYSDVTLSSWLRGCVTSLVVTLRSILPSQLILLAIRRRRLPTDSELMDVMRVVGWCASCGMIARIIVRLPSPIFGLPFLMRTLISFVFSYFATYRVNPRMLNRVNVFMVSQIVDGCLWKYGLQDIAYPAMLAISVYLAIREQLRQTRLNVLSKSFAEAAAAADKEEEEQRLQQQEQGDIVATITDKKKPAARDSEGHLHASASVNGLERLFVFSRPGKPKLPRSRSSPMLSAQDREL